MLDTEKFKFSNDITYLNYHILRDGQFQKKKYFKGWKVIKMKGKEFNNRDIFKKKINIKRSKNF